MRDKIALFCDVDRRAVVPLETADTIYSVPLILEEAGLGDFIVERLGLRAEPANLDGWRELVHRSRTVKDEVVIGVVGKYVELQDAYISVREAIHHAAWAHHRKPVIRWIDSQRLEQVDDDWERMLEGLHGIVVPGGFGYRGVEGKIRAAQFAREHKVPYLGLCLGMQVLCIEFARQVLDSAGAELHRVQPVHPLPGDRPVARAARRRRQGRDDAAGRLPVPAEGRARSPRPRTTRPSFSSATAIDTSSTTPSATSWARRGWSSRGRRQTGGWSRSPSWLITRSCSASQFHPELKSRPNRPHPLFRDFLRAAAELAGEQLPLDSVAPRQQT